jgi:hypothetical protein
VAEFVFSRRFLRELAEWEPLASPRDVEALETHLTAIAANPDLPGRVPSFYDPSSPSYLFRAGTLLIHYRVGKLGRVEFLNLFFRRI